MESTLKKERWKWRKDFSFTQGLTLNEKRLFYSITILKLLLILIPPIGTTDLARNIFYGENWWNFFFSLYNLTPLEISSNYSVFDPLSNLLSWPLNTYDYPALHLMFFAIIGLFPVANIIIAKSVFVFFDIINFYLIKKYGWDNEFIKILAFSFYFLNTYFSSIEGQVESITIFFILIALHLYNLENKRNSAYILIGLGFHWKLIQLFLFPYFVIKDILKRRIQWKNILSFTIAFSLFWIIPLIQGKYLFNSQFFTGFLLIEDPPWNPFYIGLFKISGFLNILMIIFSCLLAVDGTLIRKKDNNRDLNELVEYMPLVSLLVFWCFIYKYGNPWGWFYYLPALLIIPERNRKKMTIALTLLLIIGLVEYIILADIFHNIEILLGIRL